MRSTRLASVNFKHTAQAKHFNSDEILNYVFLSFFSKVKKLTVKSYFKSQANILVSISFIVKFGTNIHLKTVKRQKR